MPMLEARSITVDFPAVRALDHVSLRFQTGEVHGVIGENGAGKSTLMKVLSGLQAPSSGETWLTDDSGGGRRITLHSVRDALALGIAMIHQELNLIEHLTVADNVFLAKERTRFGTLRRQEMLAETERWLARVGATFPAGAMVGRLSIAEQQLVEIAKALSYETSFLIMDEPTAVLSERETAVLFELIRSLRERGVGVIYISHRLAEVEQICDQVSVLRDGVVVASFAKGEATPTEMANAMVGRPLGDMFPPRTEVRTEECAIEVLDRGERILAVHPGEIVGLAGLIGSGRTELAEEMVGLRSDRKGLRIRLSSPRDRQPTEVRPKGPGPAAKLGLTYVSEDRKGAGLVLEMNVIENVTLANLRTYGRLVLSRSREREEVEGWIRRLDIRAPDARSPVQFLSGGNQQKVSLAKWLELRPRVIILDEPTRGVDVGAKRELYQLIGDLAADGLATILISSELPELIGLCHRIVVMRGGRIVGELPGDAATEESIMALAAGVAA